jgi:hypothetical protein
MTDAKRNSNDGKDSSKGRSDASRLPAGVRFDQIVWSQDDPDVRERLDTRLLPYAKYVGVTERRFAVARYIAFDAWRIDIAWEPVLPEGGPGEVSIYPLDYRLDAADDGIPSAVLRAVPLRDAKARLQREFGRHWFSFMIREWASHEFDTDEAWAKLAMACVVLADQGVTDLGVVLHEVWPQSSAGVWNSRIHRLREGKGGRGYLITDSTGRLLLSPEATRLIGLSKRG